MPWPWHLRAFAGPQFSDGVADFLAERFDLPPSEAEDAAARLIRRSLTA